MDTVFFFASKVFWALARPESLILLLIAVGLLCLVRGRARAGRRLISVGFLMFLLIGVFPVHYLALRPLEARFPALPSVDAVAGVIVLGGGETPEESAVWNVPQVTEAGDRFLMALALAHQYPEAKVLFTGGSGKLRGSAMPEAHVARDLLLGAGLNPERLLLEDRSRNTAENAELSLAIRPEGEGAWLLVTSAFHMPRAVGSFCQAGWTEIVPWPTDFRTSRIAPVIRWDLAGHLDDVTTAMKEWLGLVAYRMTGRTHALFPSGCP